MTHAAAVAACTDSSYSRVPLMTPTIRCTALLFVFAVFAGAAGLDSADAQTKKDTKTKDSKVQPRDQGKTAPGGATFEVYKDKGGDYRFRLRDGDGNLLAISGKGYDDKAACQNVIDKIKQLAGRARVEEQPAK